MRHESGCGPKMPWRLAQQGSAFEARPNSDRPCFGCPPVPHCGLAPLQFSLPPRLNLLGGSNVGSRNSSGHQIDDSHDGGPITYVLSVLRFTFDTGPYVVSLHRERMAIAMI